MVCCIAPPGFADPICDLRVAARVSERQPGRGGANTSSRQARASSNAAHASSLTQPAEEPPEPTVTSISEGYSVGGSGGGSAAGGTHEARGAAGAISAATSTAAVTARAACSVRAVTSRKVRNTCSGRVG